MAEVFIVDAIEKNDVNEQLHKILETIKLLNSDQATDKERFVNFRSTESNSKVRSESIGTIR